ncbi:MAG: hypothetical protein GX458_06160 [Phyllobacteriaceae bacterium]|nr:hypothetical protein [Phyllobacteriaceae bacterium]
MFRSIALVVVLAALAGCTTRYQNLGPTGGVAASKMTADVWRISARINRLTDPTAAQDYVLLKAAETTVAAGGTHFVIVGLDDVGSTQGGRHAGLYAFGGAGGRDGGRLTGDMVGYSRHDVGGLSGEDLMIRVLPANASAEDKAKALDARELVANIGPRVKRPQGAAPVAESAPAAGDPAAP